MSSCSTLLFSETFSDPAENLACDEALIEACEAGSSNCGFLRFWESPSHFVVLGYSKRLAAEVFEEQCAELNLPILRRSTGGGTVLQGPGCFNYTLIARSDALPEFGSISGTNCFIMQRMHAALSPLVPGELHVRGFTDLTLGNLKFSGNAQRRTRNCLLFHGSFLLRFDLPLLDKTLRAPAEQPEYRQKRPHHEFVTNLPISHETVTKTLVDSWNAHEQVRAEDHRAILNRTRELAKIKYSTNEWNRRW